jgi:ferredoxin-NADP reductase/ferredoxin
MPDVIWKGTAVPCEPGETVLACLHRAGVAVPYSCRSGTCHLCLLRAPGGPLPERAQQGLRPTLRVSGGFLACQCVPEVDLRVDEVDDLREVMADVTRIARPAPDVVRLWLRPRERFDYRAGQYVHLLRPDGLGRPYSLASVPADGELELHVEPIAGGAVSPYLCERLAVGDPVRVRGPEGECVYVVGRPEQPLILAGAGTGLAPLLGIVRDALARRHRGPMALFHGVGAPAGLYADAELRALAADHPQLRYAPCVRPDRLEARVVDAARLWRDARVFLCGAPGLVEWLRREVFLAGVRDDDILCDPFTPA